MALYYSSKTCARPDGPQAHRHNCFRNKASSYHVTCSLASPRWWVRIHHTGHGRGGALGNSSQPLWSDPRVITPREEAEESNLPESWDRRREMRKSAAQDEGRCVASEDAPSSYWRVMEARWLQARMLCEESPEGMLS
jgi:hypothetical protein